MAAVGCSGRSLESGLESGGDGEGKAAYTQDVDGYKIMQRMRPGYNVVQGVEGKGYNSEKYREKRREKCGPIQAALSCPAACVKGKWEVWLGTRFITITNSVMV